MLASTRGFPVALASVILTPDIWTDEAGLESINIDFWADWRIGTACPLHGSEI
jgi:hypothetical protein